MKKLLFVGDAVRQTGFARVAHAILNHLKQDWDITVLGINYNGDPHDYPYPIYPAMDPMSEQADMRGISKFPALLQKVKPELVLFLNDPWNVAAYLDLDIPCATVAYIPVDGKNMKQVWAEKLNKLDHAIFYTDFGLNEARDAGFTGNGSVIPHGVDLGNFKRVEKQEARRLMGLSKQLPADAFIVGNINTNNPRKRWDLTVRYFAEWVTKYNIPENVYLYCHCDPSNPGWDVAQLCYYYGIHDRMILKSPYVEVPEDKMNVIYSALDVQISTTLGEGWGLTQMEGMACNVAQIAPDWAALGEWAENGIELIACSKVYVTPQNINTVGGIADKEEFIEILDCLYRNPRRRKLIAKRGNELVRHSQYQWKNIAKRFNHILTQAIREKETAVPFKMFGLRRTCTNLVQHLIESNFNARSLEIGGPWKHGKIPSDWIAEKRIKLIVCHKNPYAWLVSLYRLVSEKYGTDPTLPNSGLTPDLTFSEFLRHAVDGFDCPVGRWNRMSTHYFAQPTFTVRHEDLLTHDGQKKFLLQIEDFGFEKRGELKTQNREVWMNQAVTHKEMDRGYYDKEQYMEMFSSDDLNLVNSQLDERIMEMLGYSLAGAKSD